MEDPTPHSDSSTHPWAECNTPSRPHPLDILIPPPPHPLAGVGAGYHRENNPVSPNRVSQGRSRGLVTQGEDHGVAQDRWGGRGGGDEGGGETGEGCTALRERFLF